MIFFWGWRWQAFSSRLVLFRFSVHFLFGLGLFFFGTGLCSNVHFCFVLFKSDVQFSPGLGLFFFGTGLCSNVQFSFVLCKSNGQSSPVLGLFFFWARARFLCSLLDRNSGVA